MPGRGDILRLRLLQNSGLDSPWFFIYLEKLQNQHMHTKSLFQLICVLLLTFPLLAQENALAKINTEGFQNSQVFDLLE